MSTGKPQKAYKKKAGGWSDTIRVIIWAFLIALVSRIVFFQPFSIPSGSMKSTLLIGDYLFVSKFSYGYSHHSLPMSPPLFDGRIFASTPERGDVIVFKYPADTSKDYIKRLIGLPGDKIQVKAGTVWINDQPVLREKEGEYRELSDSEFRQLCYRYEKGENGENFCIKEIWRETLPNGTSYLTLNADDNQRYKDNMPEQMLVPKGYYFFMGDNRDNSVDSRFAEGVGLVPFENIVGRARMIFFSSEGNPLAFWNWRLERFFLGIS